MNSYLRKISQILLIFIPCHSFCQVSTLNSRIEADVLYNVLDKNIGQLFSFKEINRYTDGSKMNDAKCDNIIYLKYKNRFFRRTYDNGPDIRWFGCNESRSDNQNIINSILIKYGAAYVPAGIFKISGTIVVPENSSLYGSGKSSVLKLISDHPVDGLSIYRRASIRSFKLDCIETNMNLSSGILINAWDNVSSNAGELKMQDIVIVGNYPALQGVGLTLSAKPIQGKTYSIIAFCKFYDIDIYGFRDGIFCDLDFKKSPNISYINANVFENILIYNCLRPVRLINSGNEFDQKSGNSTISSNIFKNLIIQHAVGDFPAFYIDGGSYNQINAQVIDWKGLYIELSTKSEYNVLETMPSNISKIKAVNKSNEIIHFK